MRPPATSMKCVLCCEEITQETDSLEHIIPNSIGGRRKVRGFICVSCNSKAGNLWDAELARQMNPLCLFFGIVRERGEPPSLVLKTTAGEELIQQADGSLVPARPSYRKVENDDGIQIQITARTMDEARSMLEGVKRKYPSVDIETMLQNATFSSTYPKGAMHFDISFGGEVSGRSLVKTALAHAHHYGVILSRDDLAIRYLRDSKAEAPFGYYYQSNLVSNRPSNTPFHCVTISGNPSTGLLLGYIEYFGVQRIVVCLSDKYRGESLSRTYAIDPQTGREMSLSVQLPFSSSDILDIYNYKMLPDGALQEAFSRVVPPVLAKKFEMEKNRVISDAVNYGFANCGAKEGDILNEEHIRKLSTLITERMMPFIIHNMPRRR